MRNYRNYRNRWHTGRRRCNREKKVVWKKREKKRKENVESWVNCDCLTTSSSGQKGWKMSTFRFYWTWKCMGGKCSEHLWSSWKIERKWLRVWNWWVMNILNWRPGGRMWISYCRVYWKWDGSSRLQVSRAKSLLSPVSSSIPPIAISGVLTTSLAVSQHLPTTTLSSMLYSCLTLSFTKLISL